MGRLAYRGKLFRSQPCSIKFYKVGPRLTFEPGSWHVRSQSNSAFIAGALKPFLRERRPSRQRIIGPAEMADLLETSRRPKRPQGLPILSQTSTGAFGDGLVVVPNKWLKHLAGRHSQYSGGTMNGLYQHAPNR